ncbi:hypothetical protein BD626DRAFT_584649 [Schizophyllum amplum]|uniref:Uncharacterized protein n=1 Tax=Schizophyllum amplum TaxID=97359 RepID=A0A550C930_9AGAR|nr:hypothetical protein BD626DRAFT_584649 [Auriculariopsis ampla]
MAGKGKGKRDAGKSPAGGTSDREHTPEQKPFNHGMSPTPVKNTPHRRPVNCRTRAARRAGVAACLITGMLLTLYGVECVHALSRALEQECPDIFECFRLSVGIWTTVNGIMVKVLNLDTSSNLEMLISQLHRWFDGSFAKGKIGSGYFALVPVDLEVHLERIKANPTMPFPQLFNKPFYEYEIRVIGSGPEQALPVVRIGAARRTYAHLCDHASAVEDLEREAQEDAELTGDDHKEITEEEDALIKATHVPGSVLAASKEDPNSVQTTFNLHPDDPEIRRVLLSHLNPVFPILDYALKLRYRMQDLKLKKELTDEEVDFYDLMLYPAVRHWFERSKEELKDLAPDDVAGQRYSFRSRPDASKNVKSDAPAKSKPMVSISKRFAKTSAAAGASQAPPPPPDVSGPRRSKRNTDRGRTPEGARRLRGRIVPAASETGSKRTRAQASIADDGQPPKKRARKAHTHE